MTLLCSFWQLMIKRVTCLIYAATCLYKSRADKFCYSINGCQLTKALRHVSAGCNNVLVLNVHAVHKWKIVYFCQRTEEMIYNFLLHSLSLSPDFHKLKNMHDRIYWSAWWPTHRSCIMCGFLPSCCTHKTGESES